MPRASLTSAHSRLSALVASSYPESVISSRINYCAYRRVQSEAGAETETGVESGAGAESEAGAKSGAGVESEEEQEEEEVEEEGGQEEEEEVP